MFRYGAVQLTIDVGCGVHGMMPPPGNPRPAGDALVMLAEALEARVDEATLGTANLGARRFQRITRAEYERVMEGLLDRYDSPSFP